MSDTAIPKVLIVEDEAIIARDIQMQLSNAGFSVTGTAGTAAEAFQQIEEIKPDLVLMDIRIRGDMDGVETAGIVRSRYELPVIYLTAHADDATLQRAQSTEPFGYIVKPLGNTNMKAVVSMALHKHRMERELENHRKMLSTILQGLPDAIVVADPSGEVLFLNYAAEKLMGWSHDEAAGRHLLEVVPLEDESGQMISAELLQAAVAQNGVVRVPRNTVLGTKNKGSINVSGQLSIAAVGNRAAGVFISLQDITVQKREEERLSQEQQLFVAGELARGAACELYALFDLIEDCATEMLDAGPNNNAQLAQKAGGIGKGMTLQMMDFRESYGSAHTVDVNEHLQWSQPLLARVAGRLMDVAICATPDAGSVLITGNHFERLLVHLVLDAKHRLNGRGKVTIESGTHNRAISSSQTRSYVCISVRSEKAVLEEQNANEETSAPKNEEHPDFNAPIVRAIATASGGFTRISESSTATAVEVYLPQQTSREAAKAAAGDRQRVLLVIGLEPRMLDSVRRAAGEKALLLEASTLEEASLIAELYRSDIHLMVVNDSGDLPKTGSRARERLRASRPDTAILQIAPRDSGFGLDALNPAELGRAIEAFFHTRTTPALISRQ